MLPSVQGCCTGVGGRHGMVVDCCDDCSVTLPYHASDAICNKCDIHHVPTHAECKKSSVQSAHGAEFGLPGADFSSKLKEHRQSGSPNARVDNAHERHKLPQG